MKVATKLQIIAASALIASSAYAFTPAPCHVVNTRSAINNNDVPLFMSSQPTVEQKEETKVVADDKAKEEKPATVAPKKKAPKKKGPKHPDGVFSPAVRFASILMGDENLVNIRKNIINLHSDTIRGLVDTSSSGFGDAVLTSMFKFADKDKNGTIDEEELASALQSLGFTWMDEKQARIIFKRTDKDKNGTIDLEEWKEAAPMTLKTNLVRLAKQNGEEMGLLTEPVKKKKPEEKEAPSKPQYKTTRSEVKPSAKKENQLTLFAQNVIGDDALKGIDDTSSTEFGDAVLSGMFRFVDKEGNGVIGENELKEALKSLGFGWINEKESSVVFKKTDEGDSKTIDMEEWLMVAPMGLRKNLIKLAQSNREVSFFIKYGKELI